MKLQQSPLSDKDESPTTHQGTRRRLTMKGKSFDKNTFLANFQGMEDLAHETAVNFLSTLPELVSKVEAAIHSKEAAKLEVTAHTLKGAVSNFYAEPSRLLAWKLEEKGKTKNLDGATETLTELKRELETLALDLRESFSVKGQK